MSLIWKIEVLCVKQDEVGKNDVVKVVHYGAELIDGDYKVERHGIAMLDPPQQNFIPYENLTEEEVIQWVQSKLDVIEIENSMTQELETKKNPPIIAKELPWLSAV